MKASIESDLHAPLQGSARGYRRDFGSHVFANPHIYTLVQYFQSVYRNEDIYELEGVHIANFEVDIFQAVLNIVLYQMLIVTNVPVNSAVL